MVVVPTEQGYYWLCSHMKELLYFQKMNAISIYHFDCCLSFASPVFWMRKSDKFLRPARNQEEYIHMPTVTSRSGCKQLISIEWS